MLPLKLRNFNKHDITVVRLTPNGPFASSISFQKIFPFHYRTVGIPLPPMAQPHFYNGRFQTHIAFCRLNIFKIFNYSFIWYPIRRHSLGYIKQTTHTHMYIKFILLRNTFIAYGFFIKLFPNSLKTID